MNDEPSSLLLQATPALLEGWCGPVVDQNGRTHVVWGETRPHPYPGVAERQWATLKTADGGGYWARASELRLDLARAECRDRVARVVAAAQQGHRLHCTAPDLVTENLIRSEDLDNTDHRLLPDGSYWVDAAALLAVARRALGVPYEKENTDD